MGMKVIKMIQKLMVLILKKSKALSALSCRLTKWTGKSKYPIHPKHLAGKNKGWYFENIDKKDLVLDLGCGNGQHSLKTARKCRKIIAVDYDNKQLDIARKTKSDQKIENAFFKNMGLKLKKFIR